MFLAAEAGRVRGRIKPLGPLKDETTYTPTPSPCHAPVMLGFPTLSQEPRPPPRHPTPSKARMDQSPRTRASPRPMPSPQQPTVAWQPHLGAWQPVVMRRSPPSPAARMGSTNGNDDAAQAQPRSTPTRGQFRSLFAPGAGGDFSPHPPSAGAESPSGGQRPVPNHVVPAGFSFVPVTLAHQPLTPKAKAVASATDAGEGVEGTRQAHPTSPNGGMGPPPSTIGYQMLETHTTTMMPNPSPAQQRVMEQQYLIQQVREQVREQAGNSCPSPEPPTMPAEEEACFGVGIEFAPESHQLVVSRLVPGCSADVDGKIRVGDELIQAEGASSLDHQTARDIIRGKQGSLVTLSFWRPNGPSEDKYHVTLVRGDSEYVRLEHKCTSLLAEHDSMRTQLRRQSEEAEVHRKQIQDAQAMYEHMGKLQQELKNVVKDKDELKQVLHAQNEHIRQLKSRVDTEGKQSLPTPPRSIDGTEGNGEREGFVDYVSPEASGQLRSHRAQLPQNDVEDVPHNSGESDMDRNHARTEKLQEKLGKLMQQKIVNLRETDGLRAENSVLQSKITWLEAALNSERELRKREQRGRDGERHPDRRSPSPHRSLPYNIGSPHPAAPAAYGHMLTQQYPLPPQAGSGPAFPAGSSPHMATALPPGAWKSPSLRASPSPTMPRQPSPRPVFRPDGYPHISEPAVPHSPSRPVNRMLGMPMAGSPYSSLVLPHSNPAPLPPRPSIPAQMPDQPRLASMQVFLLLVLRFGVWHSASPGAYLCAQIAAPTTHSRASKQAPAVVFQEEEIVRSSIPDNPSPPLLCPDDLPTASSAGSPAFGRESNYSIPAQAGSPICEPSLLESIRSRSPASREDDNDVQGSAGLGQDGRIQC